MIAHRFGMDGLPETLSAIGRLLGCTRERVRQVESQALNKLRDQLTAHNRLSRGAFQHNKD